MIRLTTSVDAWGTPDFTEVLKKEIEQMDAGQLPLQQGLSASSYALDDKFSVMIMNVSEEAGFIHAKAGIFYSGIIAGCSCADDPTPTSELNEHCEVRIDINKKTAETTIVLLPDQNENE